MNTLLYLFIGIIPLLVVGPIYLYYDPFKVLYKYDSVIADNENAVIVFDKYYVSTTTFLMNSNKINYNAFIFGNSRSMFYQISDWKKHLGQNASCFHFDASGESLWALNKKIELVDKRGNNIENMLLVLDYPTLSQDKPKASLLSILAPSLANYVDVIKFHKTFFFSFLSPKFLFAFLDLKISGHAKPYMKQNSLLQDRERNYDFSTNELRFDYFENLIRLNKYYTPERLSVFYDRDTTIQKYSPACISETQKTVLRNIHSITQKHNTAIRIIINPLYDQLKLNSNDLAYLKSLFGEGNVYDFSGINSFTNNYTNYYENSHYRPHIARAILDTVYSK